MVYTSKSKFDATWLFPGSYEVTVKAPGMSSEPQTVVVGPGQHPSVTLSLRPDPPGNGLYWASLTRSGQELRARVSVHPYDEVYPAGNGRNVLERTCMVCHGESWLSAQPAAAAVWTARVDHMMGRELWDHSVSDYGEGVLSFRAQWLGISLGDREAVISYLSDHFGPSARPRAVLTEKPPPVDEEALAKAMYVEYYVPADPPGYGVNDGQYKGAVGPFASHRAIQDVQFDAEGNVWGTDRSSPRRLVKLDPRTGAWREWITPHPKSDIHELIIGRDGTVWLPEHAEGNDERNYLVGFNPKTEHWDHVIDLDPDDVIRNSPKWADSISIDSKNNLYVNWIMGGALTKIDGVTKKVVKVFPLPTSGAVPYGSVIDSKDNVFLAMWAKGTLVKFDTTSNTWTEFTPPTFPSEARRLKVDEKDNVWIGLWSAGSKRAGRLDMLDQTTGRFKEYPIPEQVAEPYDVAPDRTGNIWFADSPQPDRSAALGKLDLASGAFTFYPKPQFDADTPKIQVTKSGAVWYAPRGSLTAPALGVLYPDKGKIDTLGAEYLQGPPGYAFK